MWALFITLSFKRYFSWRKVKSILKIDSHYLPRFRLQCLSSWRLLQLVGIALITLATSNIVHATGNGYATTSQDALRPLRDPFTTSDRMYSEVGSQSAQRANSGQGFIPGYGTQGTPKLRLKGFVTRGGKKSAALLDVEGAGVYLVSEGDEIGLNGLGQNGVLKIIKVDANGVRVQAGQVNQVIVVR